nr:MAG TPA: hypothetical protein [Caudoviricetes sp.]
MTSQLRVFCYDFRIRQRHLKFACNNSFHLKFSWKLKYKHLSCECKGVIRSDTGAGTNRTTDFNNLPLWIRII